MASEQDESQSQEDIVHTPFTRAERLDQLSAIDNDITTLLSNTAQALQSLSRPDPSASDPTETFKTSMDAFLSTLHSVDVRLKRQIMGLEEAGIVSLKDNKPTTTSGGGGGAASAAAVGSGSGSAPDALSLEPNGLGKIGNLDVGWLNSRSSKVERDMEAEVWAKARGDLERISGIDQQGDANMQG